MITKRIKCLRKKLNLTQEEFADKICASTRSVIRWETKTQPIQNTSLRLIELVFDVNPDWLRNGVGEMFLPSSEINLSDKMNNIFLWLKSLNDDEQAWINIELPKKFPEYKEWLKDRE